MSLGEIKGEKLKGDAGGSFCVCLTRASENVAVAGEVIGDGATWIGNGAEVNFPKQIFTVDCMPCARLRLEGLRVPRPGREGGEGRLVSAEGCGRRRVLHGEQKEKTRKFA